MAGDISNRFGSNFIKISGIQRKTRVFGLSGASMQPLGSLLSASLGDGSSLAVTLV